jgi:hypothetical protein
VVETTQGLCRTIRIETMAWICDADLSDLSTLHEIELRS